MLVGIPGDALLPEGGSPHETAVYRLIMHRNVISICEEVEVFDTYVNKLVESPTSY